MIADNRQCYENRTAHLQQFGYATLSEKSCYAVKTDVISSGCSDGSKISSVASIEFDVLLVAAMVMTVIY